MGRGACLSLFSLAQSFSSFVFFFFLRGSGGLFFDLRKQSSLLALFCFLFGVTFFTWGGVGGRGGALSRGITGRSE